MSIRVRRILHMGFRRITLKGLLIVLAILFAAALDFRLCVRTYEIDSPKISVPLRVALVTDLHSCRFGDGQIDLISAIDNQNPDVILLGGDIFDDVIDDEASEQFIREIAGRYLCFYVTGNHEYWSGAGNFADKMEILEEYGVLILSGACEEIVVREERILICGLDDPDFYRIRKGVLREEADKIFLDQLDCIGTEAENYDGFTILLSHRPEYFVDYLNYDFDLALCGHAHGGQWRIPGVLNGLYAPDQGLFPKYAGGRYDSGSMTMIVSRGLARESTRIPRIFNRPELVIVNLR